MSYVYTEDSPGVLVHYGRMGMKWGQHIFGDDPRYGSNGRGKGEATRDGKSGSVTKQAVKEARATFKKNNKNRSALSDQELNSNIDRLQREQRLQQLVDNQISPGRAMVRSVLSNVSRTALEGAAYGASSYAALSVAKTILNGKKLEELAPGKQAVVSVLSSVSRTLDNKTRRK